MNIKSMTMTCPGCGGDLEEGRSQSMQYPLRDEERDGLHPSLIAFCPGCGLGVALPMPKTQQMDEMNASFWKVSAESIFLPRRFPTYYALAKARWQGTEQFLVKEGVQKRAVSILDIGAGHGFFGWAASESRAVDLKEYYAVEADQVFRKSLEKTWRGFRPGIEFQVKNSLSEVNGKFDVIVLSHVLEHLSDPSVMLRQVTQKLSADGLLFIEVPNKDYRFKKYLFPHVLFFDSRSLRSIIEKNGLSIDVLEGYGRSVPDSGTFKSEELCPATKIVLKASGVLPAALVAGVLNMDLAAANRNERGTWLRLWARKKI